MSDFKDIAHKTVAKLFDMLKEKQQENDNLKAKNAKLMHALIDANAKTSKWSADYWKQVERSAEYGAMLLSDPDSLEYKCYQKEKKIEELSKRLNEPCLMCGCSEVPYEDE